MENQLEFDLIEFAIQKLNKNLAENQLKIVQKTTSDAVDYFGIRVRDTSYTGLVELGADEFTVRLPKDYFTQRHLDPIDKVVGADKVFSVCDKTVLRCAYRIWILWKSWKPRKPRKKK